MLALMLILDVTELLFGFSKLRLQHVDSFPIGICFLLEVVVLLCEVHQLLFLPLLLLQELLLLRPLLLYLILVLFKRARLLLLLRLQHHPALHELLLHVFDQLLQ